MWGHLPDLNIATLMFIAQRSMEQRVMAAVRRAGFDITLSQARLAQRIGPEGSRLTELAEQAQITKQTASVLVEALIRAGFVERAPDPSDARARLIRFTERGRHASDLANNEAANVECEWNSHLGPDVAKALRTALEKLREVTDPYQ